MLSNNKKQSFDQFADNYESILDESITISGETSIFFAELKVKLLAEYLSKIRSSPLNILDYGCGTGNSVTFIGKYFQNSKILGVDPSAKSIEIAKKRHPHQQFTVLGETELNESYFDLIISACVFHHIPLQEREQVLKNIFKYLKVGGYFVLFEHNPHNPITRKIVRDCPFDKGVVLLKPKFSQELCTQAHLTVEKLSYYFFFPKMLNFMRPLEKALTKLPLGGQYMLITRKKHS